MTPAVSTLMRWDAGVNVRTPEKRTPNSRPSVENTEDTVLAAMLAQATSMALRIAGSAKALAAAAGVSERHARRMVARGSGNPLYDLTLVVYNLSQRKRSQVYVISAHLESVAIQGALHMDNSELVRRFFRLTEVEEVDAERDENQAVNKAARTWDPMDLEMVDLAKASLHKERAAIVRELRARGINPFEWQD